MSDKNTSTETLKQEKMWYIDQDGAIVYYDCSNDVKSEWWKRLDFTKNNLDSKNK